MVGDVKFFLNGGALNKSPEHALVFILFSYSMQFDDETKKSPNYN